MNDNNDEATARLARRQQRQARLARQASQNDSDTTPSEAVDEPAARPVAGPARIRRRHRGLVVSFVAMVLGPILATGLYMGLIAHDQYASYTGFTVRSEETGSAADIVGGLSSIVSGGASLANTEVLYAFMHSQDLVERIGARIDFAGHYQATWGSDPLFSLWPDATIEDLLWFWERVVRVSYDQSSGLMDIRVLARTPEFAQDLSRLIVAESEAMINALNEQARRDTTANAMRDVETAVARLRQAREELAAFRARTQIVDPQADIQGRMGVINNLQQQLASALVEYDLLLQTATDGDPRVRQGLRRIEVIQQRIAQERENFATQDVTVLDTDYPRLIAQFESLMVNQEFAEQTYTAALAALDAARSNAARKNLYLATYVAPTLAQSAEYPQRIVLTLLVAFFSMLAWAASAIIFYSLRDRG